MTNPAFKLLAPKNNATTPTLLGAIGASDTTIVLGSGHGAYLPTILRGDCSSTGDARTLNDTSALGSVAVGDYIYNLTDGSWAVVTTAGASQVITTPLEGGSLNVWTSGDIWVVGMFVATITQFSGSTIVKQERVLVTNRSTDTLTVVRGFDSDTALTFLAGDSVQILMEEAQIEGMHNAIRNILGKIDAIHRGVPFVGTTAGSGTAYTMSLTPKVTSLASIAGLPIILQIHTANTASATLALNGLTAKTIKKEGGNTTLAANDLVTNMPAIVVYNATLDAFVLVNAPANAPATSTENVTDKTADFTILSASGLNAYTNTGASQHIKFTLPASPAAGTVIDFLVPVAKGVAVVPNSGQTLNYAGIGSVAAVFTDLQYAAFRCIAYNTTSWLVQNIIGTWLSGTQIGFILGGNTGSDSAIVDKFTVATVPTCAVHAATLDTARSRCGGVSSWFAGYISGGDIGGTDSAIISKMSFTAETEATLAATLDNAREQNTRGMQNANTKGYVTGGGVTTSSAQIDYINFADDTSVDLGTDLPASCQGAAVVENEDVAGYYMGGGNTAIRKMVYSGESVSTISAVLPSSRLSQLPCWSGTKGYACGGNGGPIATVQALTYSGETVAQLANSLPSAREDGMGISSTLNGFVGGCSTTAWFSLLFSAETWTTLAAVISTARSYGASIQSPKR
jgi:hypothetical protein